MGGDFAHVIERRANEVLVMLTHVHNRSDLPGTEGRSLTSRNNAPSILDQQAMHDQGVPVQLVGPYNTGTLYRESNQDYYAVETGDPSSIPDLSSQHIIVVDRRNEPRDEERREPQ